MDATTLRRRRMDMATTTMAAVARVGALGAFVAALLFVAVLGEVRPASAAPVTTPADMTRAEFHDSCRKAGGKGYDITQTNPETGEVDVDYSYCKFPSGGSNRCDWIKQTCTWGIFGQPQGPRGAIAAPVDDQATADGGDAGGSTVPAGTHATPGGRTILADDDDQP